jgi:hypothetical protein
MYTKLTDVISYSIYIQCIELRIMCTPGCEIFAGEIWDLPT